MAVFRNASGLVIRCFKKVEHFADWVTGAAGPYFIAFCWLLIGSGGLFFFDVIARDLSFFSFILLSPILVLIPLNLYCHYYLVTHVPPGYPSPRAVALNPRGSVSTDSETKWYNLDQRSIWTPERWGFHRKAGKTRSLTGDDGVSYSNAGGARGRRVRRCRKCDGPKPERTHHCSVCKRCVLMMDHHCPWINACVGLHNQRHFILFMVWLSFACWTLAALGYQRFWDTFSYRAEWPAYTPKVGFTLIYVLCLAIGVAVPILCLWHIFMVTRNETSIESHDNSWLEGRAKAEGLIYLNPYDLGRRRNLQLFFNLGPQGYSPWTLLFPLVVPPSSNGWAYPRRQLPEDAHTAPARSSKPGGPEALSLTGSLHSPELMEGLLSPQGQGMAENGHGSGSRYVMGDDGGLTDDEEGGGGFMDY